jgi:hypothetical protein
MISPQIHHDFHQEIAYDVHNSLYNMIGYFSYQKISASGVVKQPRSDLPCSLLYLLFASSNHDSNSFIVLVDFDVPLMHQSLHIMSPDVLSVCVGVFDELDHDTTRNVIGAQSATPQLFLVQVP